MTEKGHLGTSMLPLSSLYDASETNPVLTWPNSLATYDEMRNDPQIAGLLDNLISPVIAQPWAIDPKNARPEVAEKIARDLAVPLVGQDDPPARTRTRGAFRLADHYRMALLSIVYGHMYFEMVTERGPDGWWRLAKLSPRMPRTLSEIRTDDYGNLKSIVQVPPMNKVGTSEVEISARWLVPYVFLQEAGNWMGRSMLRACYSSWLAKKRCVIADAMKHERTGMGVFVGTASPGSTGDNATAEIGRIASDARSGQRAGVGLPHGADLKIIGAEGHLPDTLSTIRYHDEQLAKRFSDQLQTLGGDAASGSRALGEVMVDRHQRAQDFLAEWLEQTVNAYVVERLVDINFGPEEPAPALVRITKSDGFTVDEMVALAKAGLIVPDESLLAAIRSRGGLPEIPGSVVQPSDVTPEVEPTDVTGTTN